MIPMMPFSTTPPDVSIADASAPGASEGSGEFEALLSEMLGPAVEGAVLDPSCEECEVASPTQQDEQSKDVVESTTQAATLVAIVATTVPVVSEQVAAADPASGDPASDDAISDDPSADAIEVVGSDDAAPNATPAPPGSPEVLAQPVPVASGPVPAPDPILTDHPAAPIEDAVVLAPSTVSESEQAPPDPAPAVARASDHPVVGIAESEPAVVPDRPVVIEAATSSRLVERVTQIVERLAAAGPPKTMVVELATLGGARISVTLRGDAVHLAYGSSVADQVGTLLPDLQRVLAGRGLDLHHSASDRGATHQAEDRHGRERPRYRRPNDEDDRG